MLPFPSAVPVLKWMDLRESMVKSGSLHFCCDLLFLMSGVSLDQPVHLRGDVLWAAILMDQAILAQWIVGHRFVSAMKQRKAELAAQQVHR